MFDQHQAHHRHGEHLGPQVAEAAACQQQA